MPMLDVFNSKAFSVVSLTESVNRLPYKPGRLGEMGLFTNRGIASSIAVIEEMDGVLSLLPTKRRGEAATAARSGRRRARAIETLHIPLENLVLASDLQDVRKFGTEDQTDAIASVIADRLQEMRQSHEATQEYLRVGAIQGNILDADGSTSLLNLFTEFAKTERSFDFVLGTTTTAIRTILIQVKRFIEEVLGAVAYEHVHCFAGKTWFQRFVSHTAVAAAFDRFQEGSFLRADPRSGFEFCGITFEEYRGKVGSVDFIPEAVARFVPVGVPGLFTMAYGPADFVETVNTIGIPIYAKQVIDPEFQRWIKLHTQSNPLPLCTRPEVCVKGTTSN